MDPHERIFALLAFKDKAAFIFAPELNVEEAKNSAWDGDVYGYLDHENPWSKIADLVNQRIGTPNNVAIEKVHLSDDLLVTLIIAVPDSSFTNNISSLVAVARLRKTP